MTTKRPADADLDFSDIPEVTDYSKAVRGRFHPRRLELEREVRRLREALQQIVNSADADDPSSLRAARIAREALHTS